MTTNTTTKTIMLKVLTTYDDQGKNSNEEGETIRVTSTTHIPNSSFMID